MSKSIHLCALIFVISFPVTQIIKSTTDEQILEKIKSPTESNISILPTPELTYKITKNGILNTFIFNAHSSQGYNGSIHMLVGINMDGSITGVRITDHRETPGTGRRMWRARRRSGTVFP